MKGVVAFFVSFAHGIKEFFVNDATGKLDYRVVLGIWFAYVLGDYVLRSDHLSDWAVVALVVLQALYNYGPTAELTTYFKGLYGGFRTPETQITTDTTAVDSQNTTVTNPIPPVEDINNPNPQPGK